MCSKCKTSNIDLLHEMDHGDHTCLIYDDFKDYVTVSTQYIKNGLDDNEMIFCVIDEYEEDALIKDLKGLDIDVEYFMEKGQLVLSSIKNTYRGTKEFRPDETLAFWKSLVEANQNCSGIRIMGEATFALDGQYETLERLIDYEIRVNIDLLPLFKNHQYLCVYNKNLYPAAVIKSVVRAHPNYINGDLFKRPNPYFIEPKNYLEIHREEVQLYNEFQILDDTNTINLEKELRTDQERFRYILGSIGDGVWDYDILKDSLYLSHSLILGEDKEEVVVNHFQEFVNYIHPDDVEKFTQAVNLHSQNKSPLINKELRLKAGDNIWNWYECKGKTVGKSENGQNTRIVGTFQDIQTRKNVELEKQNINKILEQKVQDRTKEISNVNKELESFSYSVSHDLRAPLRSIDGFSKALMTNYEDNLDDTAIHYIDRIRKATTRMNQLINDLLKLSRLNQNKLTIELVDLSQIVHTYSKQYDELHPDHNIKFVIAPVLSAYCDKGLIKLVFTNLLDNAVKFTSKHEQATIEFGLEIIDTNPTFYIKDDGAGFDMAYSDKLFGVFQRLHRQDEFEGNGIGLATIQRIINHHQGEVWAKGEVEKGAVFYFTLPMKGVYNGA